MIVTILYFAALREAIGRGEERLDVPDSVATIGQLVDWLARQGAGHAQAFAVRDRLLCAIDQQLCPLETALGTPKEIAFFPPVTGG